MISDKGSFVLGPGPLDVTIAFSDFSLQERKHYQNGEKKVQVIKQRKESKIDEAKARRLQMCVCVCVCVVAILELSRLRLS